MKRDFKNKVLVVTGASGNLGSAICKQFARVGMKIVALDINQSSLELLQVQLKKDGVEILPIVCDITDKSSCTLVMNKVVKHWGRIDALVNNAGITHIERYTEMDKEKDITRRVMEVNFFGAVNCTQACLGQIRKNKGFIVNISSVAGFAPLLGRTAYAASKHALHGFFESLGSELKAEGVHCLMVCPSFIQAPPETKNASSEKNSIYQDKKIVGKTVSVNEIAQDIYLYCQKNKPLLVSGKMGKMSYWLHRFLPRVYERVMIKNLKGEV
ncbi:MAG: Short chain dehydrogenase [uncultured Aureispira sp.]|uniref:Short chain dehydrogenase n=1 Tax=uncultured Aureispira sp. TaxID=1331704 RepID=A0A6S6TYF6_9BACT|nr:MAG: Short chain dehydrogenase [uncultured Aureispira sp.]